MSMSLTTSERLYNGDVEVTFSTTGGVYKHYSTGSFVQVTSQEAKDQINNRLVDLASMGTPYDRLIVPCIPATDDILSPHHEDIYTALKTPLIKDDQGQIVGIQSGRRSALLKIDGEWYRLKGCGDLYLQFPLAHVDHPHYQDYVQIRGCMFEHTVTRAMVMSNIINNALNEEGYFCANVPVGWWEYEMPNDEFILVNKCCGLFKTFGNKRLGDNILTGLEMLIPHFYIDSDPDYILSGFPNDRREDGFIQPTFLVSLMGIFGGLKDFVAFELKEKVPDLPNPLVSKIYEERWIKCCNILRDYPNDNVGWVLAYLYYRFGRETGEILRILKSNSISWGTYVDPMGHHCNSHINNLVILPEGYDRFLAPLDFDMAFTKDTFTKSDEEWMEWCELEENGMKLCIAGDEELTSGVTATAKLEGKYSDIRFALRDTMSVGFLAGLMGEEDKYPHPKGELLKVMRALIDLALICTRNETA